MKKTVLILLIFVLVMIIIAFVFALFLQPTKLETTKIRYNECVLLQNPETGEVDCFGCYNNICKDAPADYILYQKPTVGIPYACIETEQGCQLAQ